MECSHDPATDLECLEGLLLDMLSKLSIAFHNDTKIFYGMALRNDLTTVISVLGWLVLVAKGHHSKFGAIEGHIVGSHQV